MELRDSRSLTLNPSFSEPILRQPSQEHTQSGHQIVRPLSARGNGIGSNHDNVAKEPWNTSAPVTMSEQELSYLRYYIEHVGPTFDLFDPERTSTEYIPHLAMRNVGLLKSMRAVSARFKSLHGPFKDQQNEATEIEFHQRRRCRLYSALFRDTELFVQGYAIPKLYT